MKKLLVFSIILSSISVYASELQSIKIKKEVCENLTYDVVDLLASDDEESDYNDIVEVCQEDAKMEVTKVIRNEILNTTVALNIDVLFTVGSKIEIEAKMVAFKDISFDENGDFKFGSWKAKKRSVNIKDERSLFELIVSRLEKLNVHNGYTDVSDYSITDFDIEEEAQSIAGDNEYDEVSTSWSDVGWLLSDFAEESDIYELLEEAKNKDLIKGAIIVTPGEECEESEYCTYGRIDIFFNSGKVIYIDFDWTT